MRQRGLSPLRQRRLPRYRLASLFPRRPPTQFCCRSRPLLSVRTSPARRLGIATSPETRRERVRGLPDRPAYARREPRPKPRLRRRRLHRLPDFSSADLRIGYVDSIHVLTRCQLSTEGACAEAHTKGDLERLHSVG